MTLRFDLELDRYFGGTLRRKLYTTKIVQFLFTSIKLPDGKGMIWKLFPDGDEVNDRLYFNHLPTIENYYGESDSINGFDLQKAAIKAFSSLRKVFKVWNAFKVRVFF